MARTCPFQNKNDVLWTVLDFKKSADPRSGVSDHPLGEVYLPLPPPPLAPLRQSMVPIRPIGFYTELVPNFGPNGPNPASRDLLSLLGPLKLSGFTQSGKHSMRNSFVIIPMAPHWAQGRRRRPSPQGPRRDPLALWPLDPLALGPAPLCKE